jgi:hypothetical protein
VHFATVQATCIRTGIAVASHQRTKEEWYSDTDDDRRSRRRASRIFQRIAEGKWERGRQLREKDKGIPGFELDRHENEADQSHNMNRGLDEPTKLKKNLKKAWVNRRMLEYDSPSSRALRSVHPAVLGRPGKAADESRGAGADDRVNDPKL